MTTAPPPGSARFEPLNPPVRGGRLLTLVPLLGLLACATPEPSVELEYALVPEDTVSAPPLALVESGHPEITIRQNFMAAGACRYLEAEVVRPFPNQVVLRIAAMRGDPDCEDRSRAFQYTAVIRDLREGRYSLQVVHSTFDNGRRSFETVLDHPILVTR
jgi:hypothetical protein